jgi:hypothetical protein
MTRAKDGQINWSHPATHTPMIIEDARDHYHHCTLALRANDGGALQLTMAARSSLTGGPNVTPQCDATTPIAAAPVSPVCGQERAADAGMYRGDRWRGPSHPKQFVITDSITFSGSYAVASGRHGARGSSQNVIPIATIKKCNKTIDNKF